MDKKRLVKTLPPEDLKGFEDFIDGQPSDSSFLPKPATKKEVSFEHFTFLTNDAERLVKLKNLLMAKLPFATKHEQGDKLLTQQKEEINLLKTKLFEICEERESAYRKSTREIFDSFFSPPKS